MQNLARNTDLSSVRMCRPLLYEAHSGGLVTYVSPHDKALHVYAKDGEQVDVIAYSEWSVAQMICRGNLLYFANTCDATAKGKPARL